MGIFKPYWKKYRIPFITGVICVMLEAVCDLLGPTIMSKIVDDGIATGSRSVVVMLGALMLGVAALGAVFAMCRNVLAGKVGQGFGADLRFDMFKKVQAFSIKSADELESASIITRLTNDVSQVMMFVGGLMRIFLKAPITCIGGVVMSIILSPKLSLIMLACVAVVSAIILMSMRLSYPRFARVQSATDNMNRGVREFLVGIRLIKGFGREELEGEKFGKVNDDLSHASLRAMRILTCFMPLMSLTMNIGVIVVLLIGGRGLVSGGVQVGTVVALINYMTQILMSLMMVFNVFNMFVRMRASLERLNEMNDKAPEDMGGKACVSQGGVDFENVSFSYPGETRERVLDGISFTVNPGETLAVIGPTGSGKSTLAALILRWYDPDEGCVRIGGTDIRDMDIKALRERVSIAPQRSMLFSGTVMENIMWGNENATPEQVENAAKAAAAHDFIMRMPEGYDTLLGQGAVNISGGQKQRVSIARALVRRPELLILDDCTSALDALTEAQVRRALREYSKTMMCILVTQRVSTARSADKILVLDEGRNAGLGSHDELMKTCEVYREICRSQLGGEENV